MGDSETEVALFLLKERLVTLQREGFHERAAAIDALVTGSDDDAEVDGSDDENTN